MVLNRDIYRFLEGYGRFNPLRWFENRAKAEYTKKDERLNWLNDEYSKPTFTSELRQERTELLEEMAQRYPDQVDFVLPTAFGNALRRIRCVNRGEGREEVPAGTIRRRQPCWTQMLANLKGNGVLRRT